MGSYKSAAAQAISGQATLTEEHRPKDVDPANWLGKGEWITYWTQMPHGLSADIAEASTVAVVDTSGSNRQQRRNRSTVKAEFKAGRAAIATFMAGLVNWNLTDENGATVPFPSFSFDDQHWFRIGKATMSALPSPVVDALTDLIGSGAPPSLEQLVPEEESDPGLSEEDRERDTEGND